MSFYSTIKFIRISLKKTIGTKKAADLQPYFYYFADAL